jgi:hypothetical protein
MVMEPLVAGLFCNQKRRRCCWLIMVHMAYILIETNKLTYLSDLVALTQLEGLTAGIELGTVVR